MYHYVYKIEDPVTKEFYFGSRTSSCLPVDDVFYKGSMKTWKPEDKERLVKTILNQSFANRNDAILYEYEIIKNHLNDHLNRNYSLPGPEFHTVGKNCSGEKNGFFGKTHSNETKKKQSNCGKDNPSYGKKWMHKDGTRKYVNKEEIQSYLDCGWLLGNLTSGKQFLEKRIWITNEKENKFIKESELIIPDGWRLGKTYSKEAKKTFANNLLKSKNKAMSSSKKAISDTIWMHNNHINVRVKKKDEDTYTSNGYFRGRCNYKPWNKK